MASSQPERPPSVARNTDDELSLAELLLVVHRRRWLLLGCLFLGGLVGIAALSAMTPVYEARALLIIEPDLGGQGGATVATAGQTPDSASVDSQVQILASRSLAREALTALGLEADPELTGIGRSGAGLIKRLLPRQAASADLRPVDLVGEFLGRLTVKREGKSHVIALSWRSEDAGKAAAVANKLAELYVAGQLAARQLRRAVRAAGSTSSSWRCRAGSSWPRRRSQAFWCKASGRAPKAWARTPPRSPASTAS